jgi:hypothetical protein
MTLHDLAVIASYGLLVGPLVFLMFLGWTLPEDF